MDTRQSVAGVAGLSTMFALIVSLLHALTPVAPPIPQAAPQAKAAAPAAKAKKRPNTAQPVDSHVVVTGRDLLNEFYGTIDDGPPHGQRGKPKQIADSYQLGILYVTVPDPIDSHLDWAYDAQVNATRRALERDGYVIDRFWVPWTSNADTSSTSRQTDTASLRSHHPGVMLFRKADWAKKQLRLIYIVGEIPTAGVHKRALIRAFTEGDSLLRLQDRWFHPDPSAGSEVRIVGPAFSGSAPSLRRAIDQWRPPSVCPDQKFQIITGSASNRQNADILHDSRITFYSMVYADPVLARFEREVLKTRMGVEPTQIAMLQEGSTQYGQLSTTRDTADTTNGANQDSLIRALRSRPIEIPFPMHISELREEYARNPDQLIIGPEMPGDRPNVRIRVKLEEGPRIADGPPVVSDLTPPAVDAMLDDIARSLNAHHIKAVGIRATDARDVIFLGTEVRKRVRDVLLFTYGSNILYARPDVSQWLRGMLVVSTYPATGESQFWDITQQDRQRAAFSGDMAEGMYNAVLTQLSDVAASQVADYARPLTIAKETRPEIWITTVGASSMLPVTVLHDALPQKRSSPPTATTTPYTRARTLLDTAAHTRLDTSTSRRDSLIAAQEGSTSGTEAGVLVLLVGLFFAWLLRDQLDPRPVRSLTRTDVPRMMRPTDCDERLESLRQAVDATAWKTDWLAKNRIAQAASLLMQHEMYTILRVVALTIAFIGTLILLLRALSHGVALWGPPAFAMLLVVIVAGRVIQQSVKRMRRIFAVSSRTLAAYLRRNGWPSRRARAMWMTEVAGRATTLLVGVGCLFVVLLLAFDIVTLPALAARNFFYRSTAVTSGVTPGIPLVIAGMLFYAWCVWNCKRTVLLLKAKAFEQMCFRIVSEEQEPSPDDPDQKVLDEVVRRFTGETEARAAYQPPNGGPSAGTSTAVAVKVEPASVIVLAPTTTGESGDTLASARTQPAPLEVLSDWPAPPPHDPSDRRSDVAPRGDTQLVHHVRRVRVRLSLSIPGLEGIFLFVCLALLGLWGWRQFNPTIDSLVLPSSILVGSLAFVTNFDLLLRVCVLGGIGVTLFGAFRLVGTWFALREALRHLAETPLLAAFDSLPIPVARLTRLSKSDQPGDGVIVAALTRQWLALRDVYDKGSPRKAPPAVTTLLRFMRESGAERANAGGTRNSFYPHMTLLDASSGTRIAHLFAALESAWAAWPASLDHVTVGLWKGKDSEGHGDPGLHGSATSASEAARQAWLVAAGQCAAVYVVEWVEWVIHQLRNMATFLIVALILVNALLSSYPFQPQSALKAVFLGVTVITVGGLVVVLVQMNRNDVLSVITKTDPGRVTWSGPFALKLAVFILVPLGALLSTEFPSVRDFLFSWVDPILRTLGKV